VKIHGTTKIYGIVGWLVAHSLSPLFQGMFLQQRGLDAVYLPFGVRPELIEQALDGLWALGVEGFNVTVPHKEAVFEKVACDSDARMIGAVNTVRRGIDGWQATNTDWKGLLAVIKGIDDDLSGQQALLFGAGGTARAALHALSTLNLNKLFICNRNPDRLQALLEFAAKSYPDICCEAVAWQQQAVTAISGKCRLLVNTTSIGLHSDDVFPFILAGNGLSVDVVYRPDGSTAFTRASGDRYAVDGLPMLIAQGAESFAWWHDGDMPDRAETLAWMETHLNRPSVELSGWGSRL